MSTIHLPSPKDFDYIGGYVWRWMVPSEVFKEQYVSANDKMLELGFPPIDTQRELLRKTEPLENTT